MDCNKEKYINEINNSILTDEIKKQLDNLPPYVVAQIMDEINNEKLLELLKLITIDELAIIIPYMCESIQQEILKNLDSKNLNTLFNKMYPDDAVDLLHASNRKLKDFIIKCLDEKKQKELIELSKYPEDVAGAIMTTNLVKIYVDNDVKEAMSHLISIAPYVETINTLFVVDENEVLVGVLELKKLVVTKSPCLIKEIMNEDFIKADVYDYQDEVVSLMKNYDLCELAILENGILKGIITIDDAFDKITENAEDDYAKLVGLVENEENDGNLIHAILKRMPWLIILLFLDLVVALVIGNFSTVIKEIPILAIFQTAILGLAGNSGTQSLAIQIRKLSTNDVNNKELVKSLLKEIIDGLVMGIVLGLVAFLVVFCMQLLKNDMNISPFKIALIIGVSVMSSVVISNFFGALIPIIFYKLKIDPAIASGPFITTINDIIVVIIYFSIAMILL